MAKRKQAKESGTKPNSSEPKKKKEKTEKISREQVHITYEPMIADYEKQRSKADQEAVQRHFDLLKEHPQKITDEIVENMLKLCKKYPNDPSLLYHLALAYQVREEFEKSGNLLYEIYNKFPEYLFSRVDMAMQFLFNNDIDKARKVLNDAHTLKQLYPNRDLFHITEALAFHHLLVCLHCVTQDMEQAYKHLELMESLAQGQEYAILDNARLVFKNAMLLNQ